MPAPLLDLGALALTFLQVPAMASLDPGPSPACPPDMRLVTGLHYDEMEHLCVTARKDSKDTHCFDYSAGISAEQGKAIEIRVCMDQFEAPNVRGARPFVMKSYKGAAKWCGERRKRVCTEEEWEMACEGPEHRPLAYGWSVDKTMCNSDKQWRPFNVARLYDEGDESRKEVERLWQGSPSGAYATCVSAFGIYDMMGNVEEWVTSRKGRRFPGALMGGFWAKPWTGCRGTNDAHEPTFTFYETGFRCCSDPAAPDGAEK
ncbi:MAG: SUMF1/EgtB/PvdO family nonheme iron enzyme [Byssovorax sp.]